MSRTLASLSGFRTAAASFYNDEEGNESLQTVMIAAIGFLLLGALWYFVDSSGGNGGNNKTVLGQVKSWFTSLLQINIDSIKNITTNTTTP